MSMNVLVVDDSRVMRAMIVKTLRLSGLPLGEVYQASNGREGLDSLRDHWVDLVMVDINMPVMNGEEMLTRMMDQTGLKDIPKLVVSTEGSEKRIRKLEELGARFIHKPFTPEMVRDTIQEMLGIGGSHE